LTTYIVSLLKAIDIRSEPAVRLLVNLFDTGNDEAAALDIDRGAEHFAHELYSFMRSPFMDLATYDDVTQVSIIHGGSKY
jgi:E3 ubiquitin-protein ligase Topors